MGISNMHYIAAAIEASRQYAGVQLAPLRIAVESPPSDGPRIVAVGQPEGSRRRYLELVHATPEPTWRLMLLMDYAPVNTLIRNAVASTAMGVAFIVLFFLYLYQRRRAIQAGVAAKEALQQAHDQLERKVAERTADLVTTNAQLNREIAERERAELVLREAQDEHIHAGKMAVLGQMSAGITHELNQPLAALRTSPTTRESCWRGANRRCAEEPCIDLAALPIVWERLPASSRRSRASRRCASAACRCGARSATYRHSSSSGCATNGSFSRRSLPADEWRCGRMRIDLSRCS
jgi:hypothetical protein